MNKTLSTNPNAVKQRIWRMNNLERARACNRKSARKLRATGATKEYIKNYFKQWRKNPLNSRIHSARTRLAAIKQVILYKRGERFSSRNETILHALSQVGWKINLPKTKCLNHKVSIFWLFSFNIHLDDTIIYDVDNIEIINRKLNNSIEKRTVTKETIGVAKKLEKKYEQLKGFSNWLSKKIGEIK